MAGAMTKDQKVSNFKSLINTQSMVRRMTTACGGEREGKQFMASVLDLFESESALQNCDAEKVLVECLKAASLNLPIVKCLGYTYVVPFKGNPTFVIGYKGLIQLALRSGQYRYLNADAVYEGETISTDRVSGKMMIGGSRTGDNAIGYFAYFQLINGFEKSYYMSMDEMLAYAEKYSPSYKTSSSPWKSDFDSMAKKTVLRQILKYGPSSTEMREAEIMDAESAEQSAQEEIDSNANTGVIIDIPDEGAIKVDESTGEVLEPEF